MGLFSDSGINIKRAVLAISIALMCLYSHFHPPELTVVEYLRDPAAFAGRKISLSQHVRISEQGRDRFEVVYKGNRITIMGDSETLAVGELVMLFGTILEDGSISLIEIKSRRLRPLKIYVSTAAAIFIAIIVLRKFRIRSRPLRVEERF
ncbi:hypothetical protein ACFL4G_06845 [Thermodesulfobacteriota bacterium]